jgi:hypothetical protein
MIYKVSRTNLTGREDDEKTNEPENSVEESPDCDGGKQGNAASACEEGKLVHFHTPICVLIALGPSEHHEMDEKANNDRQRGTENGDRLV